VDRADQPDGAKFLFSLCINDMVQITDRDTGEVKLYRVQMTSHNPELDKPDVTLRLHSAARIEDKETALRLASWSAFQKQTPQKVQVDPLGRIHPCRD
jgi:hypothetical protein